MESASFGKETLHPLPSPAVEACSCTPDAREGRDDDERLVVVVGPCSIHDPEAARVYAQKLAAERVRLSDDLEIVMRVYFEKPRTTARPSARRA